MHVVVIGAGLVGVNTAHALLDAGHQVTLLDAEGPAAGASQGNAGMIAHVDILPLASPKVWRHLPRWLADPLGPLAIRPAYLPVLLPWLARFLRASTPARIEHGTRALAALNAAALPAWERRLNGLGLAERHLRRRGFLSVWPTEAGFRAAEPLLRRQAALGIPVARLDRSGVRALEPALGANIAAGAFYESGVHVSDPRRLTRDLFDAAQQRQARFVRASAAGLVPSETGVEVRLRAADALPADAAVLAAGAWSRPLAAALGDRIPLDTERGYNVTFPPARLGLSRPVVFEGEGFVATPLDVGDRVGGAVEFGGLQAAPNWRRVDAILGRLKKFLPDADVSGGERWMGFRPSIPDSLPVIGPSRVTPRVIYAFGHGHYGLTQSAVTGEIVAGLLGGREAGLDIAPFRPGRFGIVSR
ncbi:MAG TPA: FAD-dependent oxidoreductase [Acetobacteraceae bacterium]|nr:FAD-dependent oxidoreductase [Acetobacteraceae bacterium]